LALEKAHENASFVGTQVPTNERVTLIIFRIKELFDTTPSSPTEELNQLAILCGDFPDLKMIEIFQTSDLKNYIWSG